MKRLPRTPLLLACLAGLVAGCTTQPSGHAQCKAAIDAAHADLERAKTRGFGDFVDVVKATSLLAAATAERSAGKYQNCINHAARTRELLKPLL